MIIRTLKKVRGQVVERAAACLVEGHGPSPRYNGLLARARDRTMAVRLEVKLGD